MRAGDRHLRRRRHDRRRADDDRGGRPWQEGGAEHRRVAARRACTRSRRSIRSCHTSCSTCTMFLDADRREHAELPRREAHRLRRDRRRASRKRKRATRRPGACPAATASSATTATPRVPSRRSSSWGRAGSTGSSYDLCTGCATCFEQCPCHAIDMVPEPESSASSAMRPRECPHASACRAVALATVAAPAGSDPERQKECPHVGEVGRDGRQHGRRPHRLSRQRGLRHLSDHALVDDGGARRRVGRPGHQEHLGPGAGHPADAVGGRRGRGRARRAAERRAHDDVHGVAGIPADAARTCTRSRAS